jgi:cytochrome c-type biogenesis protein CcmF
MIPELGHVALILALCAALVQSILPLAGAARGDLAWMAVAAPAARLQFALQFIAFAVLMHAFAFNDFSLWYVANNSNSALPLPYRLSAVWGAHEGSLLLWTLLLGAWTVAVSFSRGSLPPRCFARVLGVMGLISCGFLLFMLFTSNPFMRLSPVPADGADLNPLLQDPGLIIHPPVLYTGYVGFSVAFGFAIAALLGRELDPAWARWTRPWTTAAWMFLTLGIALGSWWAYYELGWGGWWAWDPVENASFMPWLCGTALIHSLAATEKRGVFKNWTVLLAICTFALSLLGTFLVRSGVLTSVHAFATDPERGVFILALLGVVIGGSLLLYALRAPGTFGGAGYAALSRETLLLANSVLLTVALAAVLLGTLYPLLIEALGGKISVGAPYFNTVFVPLMCPVIAALGLGVLVRWRSDDWPRVWQRLRPLLLASVAAGVLLLVATRDAAGMKLALGVALAVWILLSNLAVLRDRLRSGGIDPLRGGLTRSFTGMLLAHIGLAVCIVGVTAVSNYSSDAHRRIGPGDTLELGSYRFRLLELKDVAGPNYTATAADIEVFDGNKRVATLRTEKRLYTVRGMPMTEAGIDAGLWRDVYVSLGEPLDGGDWSIRLQVRPLVRWIWLGALLMTVGGLLAVSDRRYRFATRATGIDAPRAATASSVP